MKFHSPLHHTFGPHVTPETLKRSLQAFSEFLCSGDAQPHRDRLADALSKHFQAPAYLFALGREALLASLQSLNLQPGDEVIVQGYTCIVVPNAILAAGGTPVFADIDPDTLSLTRETAEAALSPRTRAIICQHTFGLPAPLYELRAICDARNITLIEDCAHVLPEQIEAESIGSTGDIVILSFGRDKAISGIIGGAAIVRQPALQETIGTLHKKSIPLSKITVLRILLYPFRMCKIVRPLAGTIMGRALLKLIKICRCITPILTDREKEGRMETTLHTLPSPCALLALESFTTLPALNAHRRSIATIYRTYGQAHHWPLLAGTLDPKTALQKFPLFSRHAARIRSKLKEYNVHLDDGWTGCVICPESIDAEHVGYKPGSDVHAEQSAQAILSLPTHRTMSEDDARRLCDLIDPMLKAPSLECT